MGRQSGFSTREALREKDAGAGSWELRAHANVMVRWRGQRTNVGGEMYRKTSSWVLGIEVTALVLVCSRRQTVT